MSIRKRQLRNGKTGYQVRLPGERAVTFPTSRAATEYELNRKISRAAGETVTRRSEVAVTFNEAADGYLERWQATATPRVSTVKQAHTNLQLARGAFGERPLHTIGLVEAEDVFVEEAAEHRNKAKKSLEWFKRPLRDAQRRGQRFDPALLEIDPIRCETRRGVALDVDLLKRLGSWFPEQIATLPELVGSVGLRIGEALTLTDDRVDTRAGQIFIPRELCKERRDKIIQLAGFERELLAEQLLIRTPGTAVVFPRAASRRYGPGAWDTSLFYRSVWYPARDAAAGEWRHDHGLARFAETPFDGIVPHDLRHSAISLMAAGGMSPEVIAQRVGHKDGGRLILERYRHLFPDEMGTQLARYAEAREARRLRLVGASLRAEA